MYHIDAEIISLAFLVVLFLAIYRDYRRGSYEQRLFTICVTTGILASVAEILSNLSLNFSFPAGIQMLLITTYYAVVMLPVLSWMLYMISLVLDESAPNKVILRAAGAGYGVYLVFVVLNIAFNYIFAVTDAGMVFGPLSHAPDLIFAALAIGAYVFIFVNWNRMESSPLKVLMLLLPLITGLGVLVQLLYPYLAAIIPTYSVMLGAAYLLIQNEHTQRVNAQHERIVQTLISAAQNDGMTGVYNRSTSEMLIKGLLDAGSGKHCLFLIADLDDLKRTNDSYGHSEGDKALIAMAHIMKAHFRRTDVVGRMGGDEFCAFIYDVNSEDAMRRSVASLSDKLSSFISREGDCEHCSIGGAFGICGVTSFSELYRQADTALYHVKRNGKNNYAIYAGEELLH